MKKRAQLHGSNPRTSFYKPERGIGCPRTSNTLNARVCVAVALDPPLARETHLLPCSLRHGGRAAACSGVARRRPGPLPEAGGQRQRRGDGGGGPSAPSRQLHDSRFVLPSPPLSLCRTGTDSAESRRDSFAIQLGRRAQAPRSYAPVARATNPLSLRLPRVCWCCCEGCSRSL